MSLERQFNKKIEEGREKTRKEKRGNGKSANGKRENHTITEFIGQTSENARLGQVWG